MESQERQGLDAENQMSLKTNARPIIVVALLGLIFGLGGFSGLGLFGPPRWGVVAQGEVTVVSNKKTIQHQYGGTISEILVAEGERVKKGQVLIRLNNAQPQANLANIRGEYYQALALEARLRAERSRAGTIVFSPGNEFPGGTCPKSRTMSGRNGSSLMRDGAPCRVKSASSGKISMA